MRTKAKRVYLDHASATAVDPRVAKAMSVFQAQDFGNPGALHKEGVTAKNAILDARKRVARILSVHADEIVFTGSATESANIAIRGAVKTWMAAHPKRTPNIITTNIEHEAVLAPAKALAGDGVVLRMLLVDENGSVHPEDLRALIDRDTVLVSVMYANNEIGTIEPISDIAREIRRWKKEHLGVRRDLPPSTESAWPLFHTDATQASNYLPLGVPVLGVDLMTLNAAKCYGPKGVGVLYRSRRSKIDPIVFGGGQEGGLRSGTEAVGPIVGAALALEEAQHKREKESRRLTVLRDGLLRDIRMLLPDAIVNGDLAARLPNNVNISFPRVEHDFLVLSLDAAGYAVSTKSACGAADGSASHVLAAIRAGTNLPREGVRITLGRGTKAGDVAGFVRALVAIMRRISPL